MPLLRRPSRAGYGIFGFINPGRLCGVEAGTLFRKGIGPSVFLPRRHRFNLLRIVLGGLRRRINGSRKGLEDLVRLIRVIEVADCRKSQRHHSCDASHVQHDELGAQLGKHPAMPGNSLMHGSPLPSRSRHREQSRYGHWRPESEASCEGRRHKPPRYCPQPRQKHPTPFR